MDIEKQVQKAASLIARLREVDTGFRVFGAQSHHYRVGSPLSEGELRAFETKHGIELPPDYRLYLKTVGDGNGDASPRLPHEGLYAKAGAGPQYGIYRLGDEIVGERISEPFPFEEKTEVEEALVDLWDGDIPGLLTISTEGCDSNTHLVAQGAAYGTVWHSWDVDNFQPSGLSFTEWICAWAERSIPRVILERVTNLIVEGMTLDEVITLCGDKGRRSYSLERWHVDASVRHLRFDGLATHFEVGDNDVVVRIVRHSIVA